MKPFANLEGLIWAGQSLEAKSIDKITLHPDILTQAESAVFFANSEEYRLASSAELYEYLQGILTNKSTLQALFNELIFALQQGVLTSTTIEPKEDGIFLYHNEDSRIGQYLSPGVMPNFEISDRLRNNPEENLRFIGEYFGGNKWFPTEFEKEATKVHVCLMDLVEGHAQHIYLIPDIYNPVYNRLEATQTSFNLLTDTTFRIGAIKHVNNQRFCQYMVKR